MLALAGWWLMFRADWRTLWVRTWIVAIASGGSAIALAVLVGRRRTLLGPVAGDEVALGVAIGVVSVLATHVGAWAMGHVLPAFVDQLEDLYRTGSASAAEAGVPVLLMAAAEELLFRGVIQGEVGFVAAVVLYAAVQAVSGKWALIVAGCVLGALWGGMVAWREGLVAAITAHAIWTVTLLVAWPLERPRSEARA